MEQVAIISTEKHDDCTVVTIQKKLLIEPEDAGQLRDEVRPYLEDADTTLLVINFENVTYINSNVLTVALEWCKESKRLNTPIRFCNVSDEEYQKMEIINVARHYPNYSSVEAAIEDTK